MTDDGQPQYDIADFGCWEDRPIEGGYRYRGIDIKRVDPVKNGAWLGEAWVVKKVDRDLFPASQQHYVGYLNVNCPVMFSRIEAAVDWVDSQLSRHFFAIGT